MKLYIKIYSKFVDLQSDSSGLKICPILKFAKIKYRQNVNIFLYS